MNRSFEIDEQEKSFVRRHSKLQISQPLSRCGTLRFKAGQTPAARFSFLGHWFIEFGPTFPPNNVQVQMNLIENNEGVV